MTDEGTRYANLANELRDLDEDDPRYDKIAGEMDQIWWRLSEVDRDEVRGLLIAIDEVERTGKGYPPAESLDDEQPDKE